MQTHSQKRTLLRQIIEQLELPSSAYELAARRYEDLGSFLSQHGTNCAFANPHISAQGSFRLGTAVRPIDENESYDLDLTCRLTSGVDTASHSQADLKNMVGDDLENYRRYRRIQQPLESKHRCWRLEYMDDLGFHMDIVPCIPAAEALQLGNRDTMLRHGIPEHLATNASKFAVYITDDRSPDFESNGSNWPESNPEGYAKWFESRLNVGLDLNIPKIRAKVESLPIWSRKSPLQWAIQFQKRHRDNMFSADPDVKPVSIILTTITAAEYDGSDDLVSVIDRTIDAMNVFASSECGYLPNPVNPNENFADRWNMPQYAHLHLQENFRRWAVQLRADFDAVTSALNSTQIVNLAEQRFGAKLSSDAIADVLGLTHVGEAYSPRHTVIHESRPWYI